MLANLGRLVALTVGGFAESGRWFWQAHGAAPRMVTDLKHTIGQHLGIIAHLIALVGAAYGNIVVGEDFQQLRRCVGRGIGPQVVGNNGAVGGLVDCVVIRQVAGILHVRTQKTIVPHQVRPIEIEPHIQH